MNNLATIERISEILPHSNADKLLVAKVRGYNVIVPKDKYNAGDIVVLVHPDSCLPEKPWAESFKKYAPKRVKALRIRNEWSFGIIVSPNEVFSPEFMEDQFGDFTCSIGEEVAICCADDFFVVDGEYRFDTSKLGQAHASCKRKFLEAVSDPKIELIIVANTNTKPSDWQYYSDCAKAANIPTIFAVIENRHGGKDSHNVPISTLDRQANNIKMSLCL